MAQSLLSTTLEFFETPRYKRWRKHAKDLYQQMYHLHRVWPAKSVQLLPFADHSTGEEKALRQWAVMGSYTGAQEQSYVEVVSCVQPLGPPRVNEEYFHTFFRWVKEVGGYGAANKEAVEMSIERRYRHEGDVLTVRYAPFNPNVVVTASSDGRMFLFDVSDSPSVPPRPMLPRLRGTEEEERLLEVAVEGHDARVGETCKDMEKWDRARGDGEHKVAIRAASATASRAQISWSNDAGGVIATLYDSEPTVIRIWALKEIFTPTSTACNPPSPPSLPDYVISMTDGSDSTPAVFSGLDFSFLQPHCLATSWGSCASTFDVRQDPTLGPTWQGSVNCPSTTVAYSPVHSHILGVGLESGSVVVFDLRTTSGIPLCAIPPGDGDGASVVALQFCPHGTVAVAAVGHLNGDVDVSSFDQPTAAAAPSSRLLFRHTGHVKPVNDLCWSWQEDVAGQIFSVDDDALIAWKPRNAFWE